MSSANQRWSGTQVRFTSAISSATSAGERMRIALAPDRLRAPVAVERAAPGRHHVEAEVAMRAPPGLAVAVEVDEVPRGVRERVEPALGLTRRVPGDRTAAARPGPRQPRDRVQVARPAARQAPTSLASAWSASPRSA